jgi:hypothetical protein
MKSVQSVSLAQASKCLAVLREHRARSGSSMIQLDVPTSANFGFMKVPRAKILAGLLLLIFLGQCLWFIRAELRSDFGCYPENPMARQGRVLVGLAQWKKGRIAGTADPLVSSATALANSQPGQLESERAESARAGDRYHSPLWYLVASAPVVLWPGQVDPAYQKMWLWMIRIPFLAFGVFLGASLWYVSHRLYGNPGGFVALTLYCFSPGIIQNTGESCWNSEMGAAWGFFGAIFTAIAVAHTLYAPREVVLWNWRRIVLLGISLALAIGSQFSLAVLVPLTLAFLLYLAPERRRAASAIWAAACVLAGFLLAAAYFFRLPTMWRSLRTAKLVDWNAAAFGMGANYRNAFLQTVRACPLLVVLLPATLLAYFLWRRARYFGNTAPLLVVALCAGLALAAPGYPGEGFLLVVLPFVFSFVAGVLSDLMETPSGPWVRSATTALLAAYSLWNLVSLARI